MKQHWQSNWKCVFEWIFVEPTTKHGFVKTGERKLEEGTEEYIIEMKR